MDEDVTQFDVKAYLEDRDIEFKTTGKNIGKGWIGLDCPLPGCFDTRNHFNVNLTTGRIHCWACGGAGTVIRLIQLIDDCSYAEAKRILLAFPKDHDFGSEVRTPVRRTLANILPVEIQEEWPWIHLDYLLSRRFDPDYLIPKYRLMPVYNIGEWRFRIICPIILNRKIVSFIGADVTRQSTLKYKDNPVDNSIVPVKHSLYNLDSVSDTAIIVEGVTDVWRLGDGTIATFTNNFTPEQLALLASRKIKRAFVMYDRDKLKPGQFLSQAEIKQKLLATQLSGIVPYVETITLEEGDPADMSEEEVKKLRKEIGLHD